MKSFIKEILHGLKRGNGLGLAIVKRIIEICQGSIFFYSSLEKGTKFTVILPK